MSKKKAELSEQQRIEAFLEKVKQLRAHSLMVGFLTPQWALWGPENSEESGLDLVKNNPDLLIALCGTLRFFFLENEPAGVYKICNICQQKMNDGREKIRIAQAHGILKQIERSFGFVMRINKKMVLFNIVWVKGS